MGKTSKQKAPLGGKRNASAGTTITDPRFSNIHTDPRFRLPSKKHTHVKLDSRFSHMLKDDDFSRKASVDRYGRKLPKDIGKKELERFYRLGDEDEEKLDDDEEVQKELKRVEKKYDPAREGGFSSSESSSDEEEENGEDVEEVDAEEEEFFGFADTQAQQETDVPMGEISSRLAVVNLDWDNIRAIDLFAAFSSFRPSDGRILKVSVYPSEFGKERMEREEMEGPPKEIFDSKNNENVSEYDDDDEEDGSDQDDEEIEKELKKEDRGEEFDSAKLRRYQLERLRYYYAVVTLDSPNTAKAIYDATDGTEYLTSANFFDLRFIPDSVTFDEDIPRDEATSIPDNYKPNEFVTDALQHSKVKLTWDADDGVRKEVVRKAFGRKEVEEEDLKAYLGSDSSDEEEDIRPEGPADDNSNPILSKKEAERQRLRSLLGLSESASLSKKKGGPVGGMQITFSSGLSSSGKKNDSIFEDPEETTVEKYIRKERERKQRRKEKMKQARAGAAEPSENPSAKKMSNDAADSDASDAEPANEPEEDLGFDDPFFTTDPSTASKAAKKEARRAKRAARAAEAEASASNRAELELLMLPDEAAKLQHFDMAAIQKAEKKKNKKGKNGKGGEEGGTTAGVQEGFEMDVTDPRFARLWESHEFAIDPTNPRFKGTEGMKKLLDEGRRKRKGTVLEGGDDAVLEGERQKRKRKEGDAEGEVEDLKKLVEKVKGKTKGLKS